MKKCEREEKDRLIFEKIAEYEKRGGEWFFADVEDDPPSGVLTARDADYFHKSAKFRVNSFFARIAEKLLAVFFKKKLKIRLEGAENLRDLCGGAVVTSNHFAVYDSVPVILAARKAPGRKRLHKLVREGNYFMPGFIGWLLKYCDTLPLASSPETFRQMNKAVGAFLQKGDLLLIYPEQAMWRSYKKPRPYREGAFYFAAKNGVPVIPVFVTQHKIREEEDLSDRNLRLTAHIGAPIYPDPALSPRQNTAEMMKKNALFTKDVYESAYGVRLERAN